MKKLNVMVGLFLMTGATFAQTTWAANKPHTNIGFAVTHMVLAEVTGGFKDFDIKVVSNLDDFDGADVEF